MWATEWFLKWEVKTLEDRIRELEEANKSLKNELMEDMKYETELEEKIRFLEQCLDNKEKVNKSLREELENLKDNIKNQN